MGILHDTIETQLSNFLLEADRQLSEAEIAEAITNSLAKITDLILRALHKDAPAMLSWQRRHERGFNRRLARQWKQGLDLLEMLGVMCRETGEMALGESRPQQGTPGLVKFEALCRLHARACLVYQEILCLLKGGFADGALARWRSLHETATIAMFLSAREPSESERFLEHQHVDRRKHMKEYQTRAERLNLIRFSPNEERVLESEFQRVMQRFGADFASDYGWAASSLRCRCPKFALIEKDVGVDHICPYYKWACEKIHANSKGLYSALGLFERDDIMLAGASHFGLADPAQLAAISLIQATTAFAAGWGNFDLLVACDTCQALRERISDTFIKVQSKLEEEDVSLRSEDSERSLKGI